MTSSDDDGYHMYRRLFPLHDAAEAGDVEALMRVLRPRKKPEPGLGGDAFGGASAEIPADGPTPVVGGYRETGTGEQSTAEDAGVIKNGDGSSAGGVQSGAHRSSVNEDGDGDEQDDADEFHPYVDLEERDSEGATPLHVALLHRQLDAARLLLEAGAGTTKRMEGSTPAHVALSVASIPPHRDFGNAALKLLLEHNHDVSVKDDRGQTLLHTAASLGLDDAMKTLVGAPGGLELLAAKERLSCRPLHLAAIGGHEAAVGILIAIGCDANCSNLHGNTALHLACSRARWGVARILLDQGKANARAENKSRQTPADLAVKQGFSIPDSLLPALVPNMNGDVGASLGSDAQHNAGNGHIAVDSNGDKGGAEERRNGGTGGSTGGGGMEGANRAPRKWDIISTGGVEGTREGGNVSLASSSPRTAILYHSLCLRHFSCPPIRRSSDPPPENVKRLEVIYNEESGVLRAQEFSFLEWDSKPSRAQLADVLRVHDYNYVKKLERLCASIPNSPHELKQLDGDTAVSHSSFEAAMHAAGAVCDAVDRVMTGRNRNAFCAVRPPGHHAGPRGLVTCGNDAHGSHGFCLLNNVAIGAAYARCVHRHSGVDKVAIVDFDVHHGNGTEEIVKSLIPRVEEAEVHTPFCSGVLQQVTYKPWLNPEDPQKCLFVSVHGYGRKERDEYAQGWFYPGSGETTKCAIPGFHGDETAGESGDGDGDGDDRVNEDEDEDEDDDDDDGVAGRGRGGRGRVSAARQPLVLDVGMPLPEREDTPGASRHRWRDVYRKNILPKLAAFKPDLILVSAGFDAHKKDSINYGYIGLLEEDYEWVTQQLVQVANTCCHGRLVSVLEGGYRIQGGIVSAFGRSVAGHVRALMDGCESRQEWSAADAAAESEFEQRLLQERERKRKLRMEQSFQSFVRGGGAAASMSAASPAVPLTSAGGVAGQQHVATAGDVSAERGNGAAHAPGAVSGSSDASDTVATAVTAPASQGQCVEDGAARADVRAHKGAMPESLDEPRETEGDVPHPEAGPPLPSKRRRFNVDYVALQKKLQEEEASKRAAAGAGAASAPTSPPPPLAEG